MYRYRESNLCARYLYPKPSGEPRIDLTHGYISWQAPNEGTSTRRCCVKCTYMYLRTELRSLMGRIIEIRRCARTFSRRCSEVARFVIIRGALRSELMGVRCGIKGKTRAYIGECFCVPRGCGLSSVLGARESPRWRRNWGWLESWPPRAAKTKILQIASFLLWGCSILYKLLYVNYM